MIIEGGLASELASLGRASGAEPVVAERAYPLGHGLQCFARGRTEDGL